MQVAENDPIRAYWFAPSNNELPNGDGRPVSVGIIHSVDLPLELCYHGLHASRHPMDALKYAESENLFHVVCWGEVEEGEDKLCAQHRKYIACINASDVLRKFACLCALDVIHLWDAPQVVVNYLHTQDESIRISAQDAAWNTARTAANAAAWNAARTAENAAAWYAADAAWRTAACRAARAKQRKRLSAMIRRSFANAQK